jgi:hypothetical protein
MMTARKLTVLLGGLAATTLAGCGADVPEKPTWEADVRPIMLARCVRCHDAVGERDPLSQMDVPAIGNFSHVSFSDFTPADMGLIKLAPTWIQSDDPLMAMPPPPAAKLADWQIETIVRWTMTLP